jgi:hypothetical protein
MGFLKLITILIFTLMGFTIYGILYEQKMLLSFGHIFLLPLVGFWYGIKRNWSLKPIDKIMYVAFALGSFADSVILIDWGQTGEFLSISISLLMNLLILIVFRKEGTRIYSDKMQDVPKIAIPVIIIFLFFGYVLMPSVPNSIYLVSILYAILEVLLATHGFFRIAKGNSYLWVIFGVSLVLFKDAIYSFHFFIYNNTKLFLYAIQYPLNIFAYFMIAVGVALNQDNKNISKKESVWQFIKNHIKLLLGFNNLTHFKRTTRPKSSITFTPNLLQKSQTN